MLHYPLLTTLAAHNLAAVRKSEDQRLLVFVWQLDAYINVCRYIKFYLQVCIHDQLHRSHVTNSTLYQSMTPYGVIVVNDQ